MQRRDALKKAQEFLKEKSHENPGRMARDLLCAVLHSAPLALVNTPHELLNTDEKERFEAWLVRLGDGEPLSRITGCGHFWGMDFLLNESTLDPRSDSETIITTVLELWPDKNAPLQVLDIATGSGCLLLALLHEYKHAHGLGTDISERALGAAQQNAAHHKLESRARFLKTSWCDGVDGMFDLIISNPPYIASSIIPTLDDNVKNYDPLLALDGGDDGLAAYGAIIPAAYTRLAKNGIFICEIGRGQERAVTKLLANAGFKTITTREDMNGVVRVCVGSL